MHIYYGDERPPVNRQIRVLRDSDALAHYGVLGMKWGVRKDGKPQGFQYGKLRKSFGKKAKVVSKRTKTNLERTRANRNRSQLSEADLDRRIARLRKERELRQLTETEVTPGRTYVKNFLKQNGGKVAGAMVVGLGTYAVKRYLTNKGYSLPKGVQGPIKKDPWDWAEAARMIKLPKQK